MKWYAWTIIALIAALAFSAWQTDRAYRLHNEYVALRDTSAFLTLRKVKLEYTADMTALRKGYDRLLNIRDHRQDSTDRINAGLLVQNKRLRGQINPVSVVMGGDTAQIRAQLTLRDQAIDNCDSSLLVRSGELAYAKAFHDSTQAIEVRKDLVQETAIIKLNDAAWSNAEQAEKWKRKADRRFVIGLYAGYGVNLNGFKPGPQIGAGVTYRIGRF